ncbi:molybdenum cofactor biosynthesis protein B [Zooshikella ganghwensis]|uniref:molybdenum cofactor biosynthesis protein B n=1 Tax=Zooshikella ganghwensis TaxID=202772 RepID=UPI000418E18D|nr:molybdenum cofactor biosynthesis protein B [Zooshikella ganghwensis]
MGKHTQKDFFPLSIAILTVSDTRDEATDTSGQYLVDAVKQAGHTLHSRCISKDDIYQLRAIVSGWIADSSVQVILVTGGTGFTERDSTPEALLPLFDKTVDGFGELFRQISFQEIGTSSLQSRALAGLANHTLVCCLPGSTGACRTGWEGILKQQLDARHGPCNFIPHLNMMAAKCDTRK